MYVDVHVCIFLLYKFAVYNEVMFSCFCNFMQVLLKSYKNWLIPQIITIRFIPLLDVTVFPVKHTFP